MKKHLYFLWAAAILTAANLSLSESVDDAVLLRVDDETQQVRVEAFDVDASRWIAIASGYRDSVDAGWLKIALPEGYEASTLRLKASTTASPFAGQVRSSAVPEGAFVDYPASANRAYMTTDAEGGAESKATVIEEADIWAWQDSTLYFYNQYRGLQVINMEDPESPVWLDYYRYPAKGEDLYSIAEGKVVLIGTGSYWRGDKVTLQFMELSGDALSLADSVELDAGYYMDSRRYGDYLYVMTREWVSEVNPEGNTTNAPVVRLYTVSIADGVEQRLVDVKTFEGDGWLDAVLTAQQDGILLSLNKWYGGTGDWRFRWRSEVHVLVPGDDGIPVEAGVAKLGGIVQDKFKMRYEDGLLTTISQQADWTTGQFTRATLLENFVLKERGFVKTGSLNLAPGESLFASRFYGDNIYIVTFLFVDPLFAIDNSNPSHPVIAGELEVPGWSNYIEWVGDWLFAVGIEDRKLTVSTFNVGNPKNMSLNDRLFLNEDSWAYSEAQYDDQAISFFPEANVFMLPFTTWSWTSSEQIQAMQLVSWNDVGKLSLRGQIQHLDVPRRGTLMGNTVTTISGREVVTTDVSDLDVPVEGGSSTLAWNVQHLIPHGEYLLQLEAADGWYGNWAWRYPYDPSSFADPMLYVTLNSEPNVPIAEIPLASGRPLGVVSRDSKLILLQDISDNPNSDYWSVPEKQSLAVRVYDISDPLTPTLLDEALLENIPYMGNGFVSHLLDDESVLWASKQSDFGYFMMDALFWPGPGYYQSSLSYLVSTTSEEGAVSIPTYKSYPMEDFYNNASSWHWEDPLLISSKTQYVEIERTGKYPYYEESTYLNAVDFSVIESPVQLPRAELPSSLVAVESLQDGMNHYLYFEPDWQTVEVWGWDTASAFSLFKQKFNTVFETNNYAYSYDWMAPFHLRTRYYYNNGHSENFLDVWYHYPLENQFELVETLAFGNEWISAKAAMEPDYLLSTSETVRLFSSNASSGSFTPTEDWSLEFPNIYNFKLEGAALSESFLQVPAGIYGVEVFERKAVEPQSNHFAQLESPLPTIWEVLSSVEWEKVGKSVADAAGVLSDFQWLYYPDSIVVVDAGATDSGDLWRDSEWFGWYAHQINYPRWVNHLEHGQLYVADGSGAEPGGIHLYDRSLGFLWTKDDVYPLLYSYREQDWFFYVQGTGVDGLRWFYEYATGDWVFSGM